MGPIARGVRQSRWILISVRRAILLTACMSLAVSTMADESRRPKGRDDALSSMSMAIGALNRANEATSATQAKAAFTSAAILLTVIRVRFLPVHVG